jgi:CRISPR-associated protein Cas5d
MGGEKCSYHIPTYEALKGILKSVYWKPTLIWIIDEVRVMKPIKTEAKSVKPLNYGGGNTLAMYTYLADVEYQVKAHFEWNKFRKDMAADQIDGKHFQIARRMIEKGGRQDIFLGARECQGYVEPCCFGDGPGAYDEIGRLDYGIMFHGFDYPDETGKTDEAGKPDEAGEYRLHSRFWKPVMQKGVINFIRPEECTMRKFVREMIPNPPQSVGLNEETLKNELD